MTNLTSSALRISVVVPVFNGASFIREALDSILAQTRQVDEIVVVDDGSTDETITIVSSYAAAGVTLLKQQRQGPSAARNRGVAETTGDLIAFLDADDIWMPTKIEKQLAFLLANPTTGMVSCDMIWWDTNTDKRRIVQRGVRPHVNQRREITIRNFVGNPSQVMIWREAYEAVGGFGPRQRWCEDLELWTRLVHYKPMGVVNEPLIIYRWHSGGNTHDNRWEQSTIYFDVARRAIKRIQPVWWQPLLIVRAWSAVQTQRADYAIRHSYPRYRQMMHASLAFLCSPFENTQTKLGYVIQAFFGEQSYRYLIKLVKYQFHNASGQ
jgi:glycosyltransferase involved in cell wall biosynthesis